MNRNFPVIDFIGWLHTNNLPSRQDDDETFTVEERLDGVIDYQVKLLKESFRKIVPADALARRY